MIDDEKAGRRDRQDRVEEAAADSFPASDPPAWTAARTGKPESRAARKARAAGEAPPQVQREAVGRFATEAEAQSAADALLASGFNLVDIGAQAPGEPGGKQGGVLLRVKTASAEERRRALAIIETRGARASGGVGRRSDS